MSTILLHKSVIFSLLVLVSACGSEDKVETNPTVERACELFETTAADVASAANDIDAPDVSDDQHLSVAIQEIGTTGTGLGFLALSVATAGQYHFFVDTLLAGVTVATEEANPGVFLRATDAGGGIAECESVRSHKAYDLDAGEYDLSVSGPAGAVGLIILRAE